MLLALLQVLMPVSLNRCRILSVRFFTGRLSGCRFTLDLSRASSDASGATTGSLRSDVGAHLILLAVPLEGLDLRRILLCRRQAAEDGAATTVLQVCGWQHRCSRRRLTLPPPPARGGGPGPGPPQALT